MVSFVPSRKVQDAIHLPDWVLNQEELRARCLDQSGSFSREGLQNCIHSVLESTLKKTELEMFASRIVKVFSSSEIHEPLSRVTHDATQTLELYHRTFLPLNFGKKGFLEDKAERFFSTLEMILEMSGVLDLMKSSEQKGFGPKDLEARKNYLNFLTTVAGIFTPLMAALGPVYGTAATVFILGTLFFSALTYPQWKPRPSGVLNTENWTAKLSKGTLKVGFERKEILDKVADLLQARIPVLLVGDSGSGKTELLKSLSLAIARGDYPSLAGSELIHANTSEIPGMKDSIAVSRPPIFYLSDRMEGYRETSILVFDKLDRAYAEDPSSRITDQIGKILDPPHPHFPYFIGVTTKDGYLKMKKNADELLSHFEPVPVEAPTAKELLQILTHQIETSFPEALVDKKALEALIEQTNQTSLRWFNYILRKCMNRISRHQVRGETDLFDARTGYIEMKKSLQSILLDPSFETSVELQKLFFVMKEEILPQFEGVLRERALAKGIKLWIDSSVINEVLAGEPSLKTMPIGQSHQESSLQQA